MALNDHIGPDTISRLRRAASRRFEEADDLAKNGHGLMAVYLYGYCVEMLVGAALVRLLKYGMTRPIEPDLRNALLGRARPLSEAEDKSHPIDGLIKLLIQEKSFHSPPAYNARFEKRLRDRASFIVENWSPRFRYRAIEVPRETVEEFRRIASWFLEHLQAP